MSHPSPGPFLERRHGDLCVSDDPDRLDLDFVHAFLAERSDWARGIPREVVARSLQNSLCLGAYRGDRQVGFARVVTDRATFGWLADVFVTEEFRGQGVGRALVSAVMEHPDLQGVRRLMLATADAHSLYARHGFRPVDQPERFMAFRRENPYNTPAAPSAGPLPAQPPIP